MKRRNFLKLCVLSAAGYASASPPFWLETYGPHWLGSLPQGLRGINAGSTVKGIRASDHPFGTKLVLADSRQYRCFRMHDEVFSVGLKIYSR